MADPVRVKICGLTRRSDALHAARQGADYLGVVLTAGFARSVDPASAGALVTDSNVRRVAVLVDETADGTERLATSIDAHVLQLHGQEPPELLEELRLRGAWTIWKAVRARTAEDIARVVDQYGGLADGILVEGRQEGVIGGGRARIAIEPSQVRSLVRDRHELIVAGGLTPDTVGLAVAHFRPDVVDVSSGVEGVTGEKDPDLVRRFIQKARAATVPSRPDQTGTPPTGAAE